MPYRWEPNSGVSGRYRDSATGRYVSGSTVRRELDRYLDGDDPAAALADALRGRSLSLADWEVAFRRHIKNTHLNAIALERGGWANMRPQDYGRAGQIIRGQYAYLHNFANDIATGKQRLDGTLKSRSQMYTQAGRTSFYQSKEANLRDGITMVRSIRHARDSCVECIMLEGKWFRLGDPAYKLPGRRICMTRCHCTEEYGRETANGVEAVGESVTSVVSQPERNALASYLELEGAASASARTQYEQAIAAIERAHGVPQGMTRIKVRVGGNYSGEYYINEITGQGEAILIDGSADSATSFIHEFGHHLDNDVLRLNQTRWNPSISNEATEAYWEAIGKSKHYKDLEYWLYDADAPPSRYVQYLADPKELWARSYTQYVAKKTGGTLLDEIAELRKELIAMAWDDDDFVDIERAIEALLSSQGL